MKAKLRTQELRSLIRIAVFTTAAIGVGVWLLGRHLSSGLSAPADMGSWPVVCGIGAVGIVVLVVVLHCIHETRTTRRVVADALRGRPPMSDEVFGRRFYEPDIAPVASRLRRLLAENLDCDLAGMVPSDDFTKWLALFPGLDSAADMSFEELAIEFQLTRDCPWPERFESFDALARFVAEHACPTKTH